MKKRIKSILKKLALLSAGILIACLAGEFTLRLFGFHGVRIGRTGPVVKVDDEILDYRLRPDMDWVNDYGIPVHINSKGWRDHEYDFVKGEGVFRILMLGDSVLNGHGVRIEDVYAKHLERRLNGSAGNVRFEVVMLSIGALSSIQEAHLLEVEGLKYDPDLVMVGYVLNDPGPGSRFTGEGGDGGFCWTIPHIKNYLKRSSLILHGYRTLEWIGWKTGLKIGGSQLGDRLIDSDYYSRVHTDAENWGYVVRAFEKIGALCRARDIPAAVAIFPVIYRLDDYSWEQIHKKVADAAEKEGLMILDLLPVFRGLDEKEIRLGWGDYVHPNRHGHQVAGDAILQFFQEGCLIPQPQEQRTGNK